MIQLTSVVGERNLAMGGDAYGSAIVMGDIHQAIAQRYPSLRDFAFDFNELTESVTRRFVGRDELFQRLADFATNRCGYFRVVADAGLGKTALAAEAARRLDAPSFFVSASSGLTRPDQCLNHLAVELIARFGLPHDHLPPRAGEDSAFLSTLLAAAAAAATSPIWLVVDALDEADSPGPGRNTLLLPNRLPRGVYVLLTHRPADVSLATDAGTATEEHRITHDDERQQLAIVSFLREEARRDSIKPALEAANPPVAIEQFVAFLKAKSEGNFKYLDYVLADIAARTPGFDPLDLAALPRGLQGYYRQFWQQMERVRDQEGWAEWHGLYRPAIAFLAAAREAVPASWLASLVGRPAAQIEDQALRRWRRFLNEDERYRPPRWRVVHQSFVDFLVADSKVDLSTTHERIASLYISGWGGLDEGLPALSSPTSRGESNEYGLRHVAEHLERAGRVDDLHRLLCLDRRHVDSVAPNARVENAWYAAHEQVGQTDAYMSDLARAARLVHATNQRDYPATQGQPRIGLQIRYALMSASLNSLARNVPPSLIGTLVERGIWHPPQALAYARVLEPEERVRAFIAVGSHLRGRDQDTVFRDALDSAAAMGNDWHRWRAISEIVPLMAQLGRVADALNLAREIANEEQRDMALAALVPCLAGLDHAAEALAAAGAIKSNPLRSQALMKLGFIEKALLVTGRIGGGYARADVLAAMAPGLPELRMVEKALAAALAIRSTAAQSRALAALAPRLSGLGRVEEALELARGIGNDVARVQTLGLLGRAEEALVFARVISDEPDRFDALMRLAPLLTNQSCVDGALKLACGLRGAWNRDQALAALALRFSELGFPRKALRAAEEIEGDEARVPVLAAAGHVDEALALAAGFSDEGARARALDTVSRHLVATRDLEEAFRVSIGIRNQWDQAKALEVLSSRLMELGFPEKAEAVIGAMVNELSRSHALASLAQHLSEVGRPQEALEVARGIGDDDTQIQALVGLGHVHDALEVARRIGDGDARVQALAALDRVEEALELARAIGIEPARAEALAKLAPRLVKSGRVQEAFEAAHAGGDHVLARLLPMLATLGCLKDALDLARSIRCREERTQALRGLARRFVELGHAGEALDAVRRIRGERARARALAELAPRLTELDRVREAMAMARGFRSELGREQALASLAPCLAEFGHVEESLAISEGISDERYRAHALAELAPHLAKLGRITQALEVTQRIRHEEDRDCVLALVAPCIADQGGMEHALGIARSIRTEAARDYALAKLAPRLNEAGRTHESMAVARSIGDARRQASVMARLGRIKNALEAAQRIRIMQSELGRWLRSAETTRQRLWHARFRSKKIGRTSSPLWAVLTRHLRSRAGSRTGMRRTGPALSRS